MHSSVLFTSLLLLSLLSAALAQSEWIGVWQDRCKDDDCYGGNLFTCVEEIGDTVYVYGTYSDIGYVIGILEDDKVTGSWYEAGYEDLNYGGFEWKLLKQDGDILGFSGNWYNEDDLCLRYAWYAPKLQDGTQEGECGGLLPQLRESGGNIEGRWTYTGPVNQYSIDSDDLFICLDTGDYFHASNDPGTNFTSMYYTGTTRESAQIAQASTFSINGQGIALMVLIDNNRLLISHWAADSNIAVLDSYDVIPHRTYIYRKSGDSITNANLQQACNLQSNFNGAAAWSGTFFDPEFGKGRFYLCPTQGNIVQGIFSELGWIYAQANGPELSGLYYTAGREQGSFTLQLQNNGHSFSGFYSENGNNNQIPWEADRVDVTSAYAPANCWRVPDNPSSLDLEGEWYYGSSPGDVFDICIDNDQVTVSYQYNGHVQGYGEGRATNGGTSIQLTWYEENASGISLYRYNGDTDTMLESLWAAVNDVEDIYYEICDEEELDYQYWGLHSVNRNIKRVTDRVTQQQCRRNSKLKSVSPELSTYTNDYFYSPPSNSAAAASISLILLFVHLILL